jgi:hypothetical protein
VLILRARHVRCAAPRISAPARPPHAKTALVRWPRLEAIDVRTVGSWTLAGQLRGGEIQRSNRQIPPCEPAKGSRLS